MSDLLRCWLPCLSLACLVFPAHDTRAAEPQLLINEFLASNSSILADDQSEYDDWIEVHNPGGGPVDTAGMYLTDDLAEPTKWRFPTGQPAQTTIPAGGYLLVWADNGHNERGLHAAFSLDAGGEEVCLFDTDGRRLIDAVAFGRQMPDVSFGRYPDGHTTWQLMASPTPGAANAVVYDGFVEEVRFSHDRGFYEAPFSVTLTTPTPGATIWFATDGSEPRTPLPRGVTGTVYTGPFEIGRTTCLRAKAVRPGWRPSATCTHTYIFPARVLDQSTHPRGFPQTWGETPADYGMDAKVVNDPLYGPILRDALLTHRTISLVFDVADLFDPARGIYVNAQQEGESWERPVSVEVIDPAGGEEVHINAGLRIQGGASRSPTRPKHNMRLLFKGIYGAPKLEFPMFADWPVRRFDTLILRGGNGDSWFHPNTTQQIRAQYIRDQWPRDTQVAMGRLTAGQCYVHLYMNGLYWGLYHVIERPNASFFAEHLGGEPQEYDVLQHKNGTVDGNRQAWNAMMAIANGGLVSADAYAALQEYMDIPNLIDYLLMNFYMGNVDWDQNNWYGGRRRRPGEGFQFLSWDSERTFLNVNDDVTGKNVDNQPTHLHQQLTANPDYRMLFADHVHRHFFNGDLLTPASAAARWRARAEEIRLALVAESARWGDSKRPGNPYTPDVEWQAELDFLTQEYFPKRTGIVLGQLKARGLYPEVEAPMFQPHGGPVEPETGVALSAPTGAIWYTTDDSDPRLAADGPGDADEHLIVPRDAPKRILVPARDIGSEWRGAQPFDDSGWTPSSEAPGGVGYERQSGYEAYISVDVAEAMYGQNATCYIRIPFTCDGRVNDWNMMALKARYDDGFIACLNGIEIARRNFEGAPAWNSRAAAGRPDVQAVEFESIDVSDSLEHLRTGANLLALHGLNASPTSSDFLIDVELIVRRGAQPARVNPAAVPYAEPLMLARSTRVKARTLSGGLWSALNEATFAVGPVAESLRITEIMYHPMDDEVTWTEPNTEFIELQNVGAETINLNLVRFTKGIDFTFGATDLLPGQFIVLVEDLDAFRQRYGAAPAVAGRYTGKLDNGGERLRLEDAIGGTIADFAYDDDWHPSTDGKGFSLVLADPARIDPNGPGTKDAWRRSIDAGGSPGADDGF